VNLHGFFGILPGRGPVYTNCGPTVTQEPGGKTLGLRERDAWTDQS
jgi:hypothetical protein